MVQLNIVKSANAELVQKQPLVAVFFGGTSGIGHYTVRALAKTHADTGKGLRVYIIGRNADAAEKIIKECQHECQIGIFTFVKATDLSLLSDVDTVCQKLADLEKSAASKAQDTPRIDFLVMSHSCPPFLPKNGMGTLYIPDGSIDTTEGLDDLMSFLYYSRMRITMNLMPLLLASSLPARVVSIYAGGMEAKLIPEDLSLHNPKNYNGLEQIRSHVCYMTTLFFEALAEKHREHLSLIHIYPGLVITPGFDDPRMPPIFRFLWTILGPLLAWVVAVPAEECGARMLYSATSRYPARAAEDNNPETTDVKQSEDIAVGTDTVRGSGAYALNWNGDSISVARKYNKFNKEELRKKVWDHTMEVFNQITAGKVFKG